MAISIRPHAMADDDALWDMLRPVFRAGDTYAVDPDISRDDALAYWGAPGKSIFIAETDRPLGSYYLGRNAGGGGAHVCNCGFVTHPQGRGQGVAQAMLDHSLATARAQGFAAMQFNFVVATNTGAIRLWTRAGFETIGALPNAFSHPEQGLVDALVMFRTL
jgi:ribosomal protein S18 acetylase RimI-like enzyme